MYIELLVYTEKRKSRRSNKVRDIRLCFDTYCILFGVEKTRIYIDIYMSFLSLCVNNITFILILNIRKNFL